MRNRIQEIGKLNLLSDGGLVCVAMTDEPPPISDPAIMASFCSASANSELVSGDFVAHFHHGIARYVGRKRIPQAKGGEAEFAVLEFAQGSHLYVPDDRHHLIQKLSSEHWQLSELNPRRSKPPVRAYVIEALSQAYTWPGLGAFPPFPEEPGLGRKEPKPPPQIFARRVSEWRRACAEYMTGLHADIGYRQAAQEYYERQNNEPHRLLNWWAYRESVLHVRASLGNIQDRNELALLIKQCVLRREREMEKIRRKVEALEQREPIQNRESIPEEVRLYVWRRDQGRCQHIDANGVCCGSRDRLEFDHIIPVALGGGNTARNIQLLCERHNRAKSDSL